MKVRSFGPIIADGCSILILGSMPGGESLRKGEYYGNPRNSFWRIMFALLNETPTEDYTAKKRMLLAHNIALWDVIRSCEREGSLDSDMENTEPNDFKWLYTEYPNIKHVFFNGAKAYDTYKKYIGFNGTRSFARLPSTSPANTLKFENKLSEWKKNFTMS